MTDDDWTRVAEFGLLKDAQSALMQLVATGVPAAIRDLRGQEPTYDEVSVFYVWVPTELADQANSVLNTEPISEEELTREALESPPIGRSMSEFS